MRSFIRSAAFLLLIPISNGFCEEPAHLDLGTFLKQVRQSHQGYLSSIKESEGAIERSEEGTLIYQFTLFTDGQHIDDRVPTASVLFQGDRTVVNSLSLGVSKQTSFGLQTRLSYNLTNTTLYDVSPLFVPQSSFYDTGPMLEVSMPLLRNGFGSTTRATEESLDSQAKATSFSARFNAKVTLSGAETLFWRLSTARQVSSVLKQSLDRALQIRDLNANRQKKELIDRVDLLQSEAALKSRELDYQTALDDVRDAARSLNSARGVDSDEVHEVLDAPPPEQLMAFPIPKRAEKRDDVIAAEHSVKATSANVEIAREAQMAKLDLVGSVAVHGRQSGFSSSVTDSLTTQHPTLIVGFKFSAPLDPSTVSAVRGGYLKESQAAELNYQRKLFEQENDWESLNRKLSEARRRLDVAHGLEDTQQEKLAYERKRLKQGRSTTFQVLQFELDYLTSQLTRLRNQSDIFNILAQMKTFEGDL